MYCANCNEEVEPKQLICAAVDPQTGEVWKKYDNLLFCPKCRRPLLPYKEPITYCQLEAYHGKFASIKRHDALKRIPSWKELKQITKRVLDGASNPIPVVSYLLDALRRGRHDGIPARKNGIAILLMSQLATIMGLRDPVSFEQFHEFYDDLEATQ